MRIEPRRKYFGVVGKAIVTYRPHDLKFQIKHQTSKTKQQEQQQATSKKATSNKRKLSQETRTQEHKNFNTTIKIMIPGSSV